MSRLFKTLTGIASAAVAGVVAKLCYDVYQEKRNRDILDQEFFDDIEDDFEGFDDDFSKKEVVVPKTEEVAQEPKKEEPKKEELKKEEPKKEDAKKETLAKLEPEATASKKVTATKKPTATKKMPTKKAATSLTCQDVIDCVADVLDVSSEDILSKSRKADVANARRIAIFVCANELKVSNATICDEFGGIGSTSVTNAKKSVADKIKEDDIFASDVEDVIAALKGLKNSLNR